MEDMTNYEKIEFLISEIRKDGFDYTMIKYSKWNEIEDQKFHKLRRKYIKSKNKLHKRILNLRSKYLDDELE